MERGYRMTQLDSKNCNSSTGIEAACSADDIRQQLQRILKNPDFSATRQQRAFLAFVVMQTLAGKGQNIKGYTVATQVFGRDENFDQATDPIVSIQANKLRRALERYYLLSGKENEIHIAIPKGTYVPVFSKKAKGSTTEPASHRGIDQERCFEGAWPTVLIKPFLNLTNCPEKNYLGVGFATELATEINRFQSVCVLQYGPTGRGRRSSDIAARFVVEGNIREDKTGLKLLVNLLDVKHSRQIWSDTQWFDRGLTQIIKFQEEIAAIVGAKIAGEYGIIPRILSGESAKKQPDQLQTYEAILRYHQFDQTLTPEHFLRAYEALESARIREPECGLLWTFLARLHANIFSLEIPGFDVADSERKALEYAEKGARLNPDNQGTLGMLAFARMLHNDVSGARRDIKLAYRLNPNSLYLMDGIGYIMTLLGDWELGPTLIRKVMRLNPFYKPLVHYALWVDSLRQHDYQGAYLETKGLRRPALFWYPLAKASTLGLLGRIAEGKKFANDLMKLKPDFQVRGRVLIGRYIKFKNITDRVIEGLNNVGVKIT